MSMIYCDNAAATRVSDEVLEEMLPYLKENYGNASSIYSLGVRSKKAIETAREKVACAINASPDEIYFTSGATESNNWALAQLPQYKPVLTSAFEHPSVENTLKKNSPHIIKVFPKTDGVINMDDVKSHIWNCGRIFGILPNISIMAVNNEIGTIQPIKEIGEICHMENILFHTDATQAIGHIPVDVNNWQVDMMSFSGHKFHAPKGIGVLYVRRGTAIESFIHGGSQEHGMRAGTENAAAIVGLGKAIEIAGKKQSEIKKLRNDLWDLLKDIEGVRFNGNLDKSIANILNISIDGCNGENMVLELDMRGICVSNGSACAEHSLKPSQTLKAIGLTDKQAFESIRISIDENINFKHIMVIASEIRGAIKKLREEKAQ